MLKACFDEIERPTVYLGMYLELYEVLHVRRFRLALINVETCRWP